MLWWGVFEEGRGGREGGWIMTRPPGRQAEAGKEAFGWPRGGQQGSRGQPGEEAFG